MERLYIQGKQSCLLQVKGESAIRSVKDLNCDDSENDRSVNNEAPIEDIGNNIFVNNQNTQLDDVIVNSTTNDKDVQVSNIKNLEIKESDIKILQKYELNRKDNRMKSSTIRTVTIFDKQNQVKNVELTTINLKWKKPWCGGYKNTKNNKMYWNAYAQTILTGGSGKVIRWPVQEINTVSRYTQTYLNTLSRSINTGHEKFTQTPLKFEDSYHKIIVPFKYTPRELIDRRRSRVKHSVLVIQKWVKRHLAVKEFRRLQKIEAKYKNLEEKRKKEKLTETEINETLRLSKTTTISNKYQLDNLEKKIINWKEKELSKIISQKTGPAKYASLYEIMDFEIKHLYQYESIRLKFKRERESFRKEKFLKCIDTSTSKKAKNLKELYDMYVHASGEERLYSLTTLIDIINKLYIDFEWANDLIDLISREYNMLLIGYREDQLNYLQVRTETLLFNLLLSPIYNPLAEKYLKPSNKNSVLKKKYVQSSWVENLRQVSKNLLPYSVLLKMVRDDETVLTANSWTCWKINQVDMYYLIDIIWNGRSIITEVTDLNRLRSIRWDKQEEWSPWNCILLTEEEAIIHTEILNFESVYDKILIDKIKIKHIIGKMSFSKLYDLFIERFFTGCNDVANNKNNKTTTSISLLNT